MTEHELLVASRLLDLQIVDVNGRRCGRVDDVELSGDPPRVTAVLTGEGLYHRRLPGRLSRLAARMSGEETWGSNCVRVPWQRIEEVGSAVVLNCPAEDAGLGFGDDPARWGVSRLPWN
jgi:sporulation protein YlmC with PRC-barrel domain